MPNANIAGLLLCRFKIQRVIDENAYLKKYSTLQQGAHKLVFSDTPMAVCIFA